MAEPMGMPFWVVNLSGPKVACIRRGAHWRHLANTTEPSVCGGDAVILSNYSDHSLLLLLLREISVVILRETCSRIADEARELWRSETACKQAKHFRRASRPSRNWFRTTRRRRRWRPLVIARLDWRDRRQHQQLGHTSASLNVCPHHLRICVTLRSIIYLFILL